jgi:hypothetical protein
MCRRDSGALSGCRKIIAATAANRTRRGSALCLCDIPNPPKLIERGSFTKVCMALIDTTFSLRLHYSVEAGKEGQRYHLNRPDLAQAVAVELRTCQDVKSQQRLLAARL